MSNLTAVAAKLLSSCLTLGANCHFHSSSVFCTSSVNHVILTASSQPGFLSSSSSSSSSVVHQVAEATGGYCAISHRCLGAAGGTQLFPAAQVEATRPAVHTKLRIQMVHGWDPELSPSQRVWECLALRMTRRSAVGMMTIRPPPSSQEDSPSVRASSRSQVTHLWSVSMSFWSNSVVCLSVESWEASASRRPLVSHPSASWRCDWHYYLLSFESQRFPVPAPSIFICIVDGCEAARCTLSCSTDSLWFCSSVPATQHQIHTETPELTLNGFRFQTLSNAFVLWLFF